MAEETEEKGKGFGDEGSFASKLVNSFQKTFGLQNQVNEKARKEVAKLGTQVKFTNDLINKNRKKLEELAQTDSEVAKFLESYDNTNFVKLEELRQAVLEGTKISEKDGKFLVESFQQLQESFGGLGIDKLEANLGDVLSQIRDTINKDELDRETQREFLNDFISVVSSQELSPDQQAVLELLQEEQAKGFNFEQDQLDTLNDIFQFFEESKIGEIKQQGTLDDLSRKFSSFIVNQDEIKQALEEQQFDGEALKDILTEGLESDTGQGILDTVLAAIGLPGFGGALSGFGNFAKKAKTLISNGFGKIFGKSGVLTRIFGKGGFIGKAVGKIGSLIGSVGKVFGGVTKFFGGVGKIAGPVLKAGKFLKVIPVVGTIIAAISGVFDAISGFFNADEISGKSEEMVTMGDRIQASISAFLSGLTFGFVKAEDIFSGIDKAIDYLFGDDGLFSDVLDGISSLGDGISSMLDKILNFDFKSLLPDSISSFFGDDEDLQKPKEGRGGLIEPEEGMFDRLKDFFGGDDKPAQPEKIDFKNIEVDPAEVAAAQAKITSQYSSPAELEERARRALTLEDDVRRSRKVEKQQPQVVIAPTGGGQQSAGKSPKKRNTVDDMTLSAISVGLLD